MVGLTSMKQSIIGANCPISARGAAVEFPRSAKKTRDFHEGGTRDGRFALSVWPDCRLLPEGKEKCFRPCRARD